EIIENVVISGSKELQQVEGRQPDLTVALDSAVSSGDIIATRINDDAIDDAFVFTHYDASQIKGILLLSN
ncbi:MAG: hypothetical protein MI746_10980, partial [Pseudomonadales bacterium]|nr:hypothetical protein [Pseudomonadales bacterium]